MSMFQYCITAVACAITEFFLVFIDNSDRDTRAILIYAVACIALYATYSMWEIGREDNKQNEIDRLGGE